MPLAARQQTRESLAWFNWTATLRAIYDTVCSGGSLVFVPLALGLGVRREDMGFFGAVTSFACLLQFAALALLFWVSNRKRYVIALAVVEPLLLVGLVAAALVAPPGLRLPLLALALFLGAALRNLQAPVTDDWLATSIPEALRGRYIGLRNQVLAVVTVVAAPVIGYVADHIDKSNTAGYIGLFSLGAVVGVAAASCLSRAHMPPLAAEAGVSRDALLTVWRNPPFRRFLTGLVIYNAPFYLAGAFYTVFSLEVLKLSKSQVGLICSVSFLLRIGALRVLGRLANRLGPVRLTLWGTPLYMLWFFGFAASTPAHWWPLVVGYLCMALGEAAYGLGYYEALCRAVPEEGGRPAYFATANVVSAACGTLLPALAVPLLDVLHGFAPVTIGGQEFTHFHMLFLISTLMMVGCGFGARLFVSRRVPGAVPASGPPA